MSIIFLIKVAGFFFDDVCKMLILPKTVSLDSSHWSKWMRCLFSTDIKNRERAVKFQSEILKKGYTIVFSWHQLEELVSFDNDEIARRRIEVLRNLPLLSWIATIREEVVNLGGITDIFAAEVIAFMQGQKDLPSIREHARRLLIRSGTGANVIINHPNFPDLIIYHARRRRERARTLMSIIPFDFVLRKQTLGDLCSGNLRSQVDRIQKFRALERALTRDIAKNGDEKIQNPEQVASDFIMGAIATGESLQQKTARDFVFAALKLQAIEPNDVDDQMTLEEVGELGVFFSQLRTIAPKTGYSFEVLKKHVTQQDLPHRVLRNALRKYSQVPARRKGSDLNDEYLACLSPYVDITFIDRRTAENFRRAHHKSSDFSSTVGKTQKCADWTNVLSML